MALLPLNCAGQPPLIDPPRNYRFSQGIPLIDSFRNHPLYDFHLMLEVLTFLPAPEAAFLGRRVFQFKNAAFNLFDSKRFENFVVGRRIEGEESGRMLPVVASMGCVKAVQAIMNSHIGAAPFAKALKGATERGHLEVVTALLDGGCRIRDGVIIGLHADILGPALRKAAGKGYIEIVRAIMSHNQFTDISFADWMQAVAEASGSGQLDSVRTLLEWQSFSRYSCRSFGQSLILAAAGGYPDILASILDYNRSNSSMARELRVAIERAEPKRLLDLLCETLLKGLSPAAIREFYAFDWEPAFHWSAEKGHLGIAKALMKCRLFSEISSQAIGDALIMAASEGHLGIVSELISCSRFKEISFSELGNALKEAATGGHLLIVQSIMACKRFSEISSEAFAEAFIEAAKNGSPDLVRAFIKCAKPFSKVSSETLIEALGHAKVKNQADVVNLLSSLRGMSLPTLWNVSSCLNSLKLAARPLPITYLPTP